MSDSRRAFDFSPLPQVLCINISNVNNSKTLAFRRGESTSLTDPGLQKLPSNRQSCPAASLPAAAPSSAHASPSTPLL